MANNSKSYILFQMLNWFCINSSGTTEQVHDEAARIDHKQLITLKPGITEDQTRQMKERHLQLVVPRQQMAVRRHLHALGFRYRLHSPKLPGHPDIVLPKWHTVIFVNGCFWHRHEGCKTATMPKSNIEFWKAKFDRNVARDKKEHAALEAAGWHVIVLWECEVKKQLGTLPELICKG